LCRFHVAKDFYEKIEKRLQKDDHQHAVRHWKALERSKTSEELQSAFENLKNWCQMDETRHTFGEWIDLYTSGVWLQAMSDIDREENFGLWYTNNASEASIRNLIPTRTKHIKLHQFLEQLMGSNSTSRNGAPGILE
jgi:hypothetical protein